LRRRKRRRKGSARTNKDITMTKRLEKEKAEQDKAEKERVQQEKVEKAAKEKAEKAEKAAKEKAEKERLKKEKNGRHGYACSACSEGRMFRLLCAKERCERSRAAIPLPSCFP